MVITHGRRRVTMGSTGMTTLTLPSSRRGRRASRTGGSSPSRGVGTSPRGLSLCLFALNLANQLPQWPRSPLIFDTFDSCCSPEGKPVRFVEQEVRCQMSTTPDRAFSEVRFLTVAEVAAVMRVSKMTVYRLVHGGELPAVRVGRSFRVPEQAVHDYLRDSFVETA